METKTAVMLLAILMVKLEMATQLQNILTCLEEIISTQFSPGEVIVFSLPYTSIDIKHRPVISSHAIREMNPLDALIVNIASKANIQIIISTDYQISDQDILEPHHGYVLFIPSHEDVIESIEYQINNLKSFSFSFNRRGKFMVVFLQQEVQDSLLLSKKVLKSLWDWERINAITIITGSNQMNQQSINIYSLFPYDSEECGESENLKILDKCSEQGKLVNQKHLLPRKVPSNLNGCKFKVYIWILPPYTIEIRNRTENDHFDIDNFEGIDLIYLQYVSKAMNFSLQLDFAGYDIDETLNLFLKGNGIYIGGALMTAVFDSFSDPTKSYFFQDHRLFVPCARRIRSSGNILEVFTVSVWFLFVTVLFLKAILFWCLQKNDKVNSYRTLSGCMLNVWAIVLSVSVDGLPVRTKFRIFFYMFVSYAFVVSMIFQSFFTSFLIDPRHEKEIESIQDLNDKSIPIIYAYSLENEDIQMGNNLVKRIRNIKKCENYFGCLVDMLKYQKYCVREERYILEYLGSTHGLYDGFDKIYCSIMSIYTPGVSILLVQGDPLLERFNYFIQKCVESGISNRYLSLSTSKRLVQNYKNQEEDHSSYLPFGLFHFRICFLLLVVGYSVSICVWFLELIVSKNTLERLYEYSLNAIHSVKNLWK
ncbi:Ionotropic receptor 740 [Blattella germanica]|nr:Ionotropic receptor 740 [Blattella germanica]